MSRSTEKNERTLFRKSFGRAQFLSSQASGCHTAPDRFENDPLNDWLPDHFLPYQFGNPCQAARKPFLGREPVAPVSFLHRQEARRLRPKCLMQPVCKLPVDFHCMAVCHESSQPVMDKKNYQPLVSGNSIFHSLNPPLPIIILSNREMTTSCDFTFRTQNYPKTVISISELNLHQCIYKIPFLFKLFVIVMNSNPLK